jgi:hypothetical protein
LLQIALGRDHKAIRPWFRRYGGIVLLSAAKSTRQGAFRLKSRPALTTEGR